MKKLSAEATGDPPLLGGNGREAKDKEGKACFMDPLDTNKSRVSSFFICYFQRTGLTEYLLIYSFTLLTSFIISGCYYAATEIGVAGARSALEWMTQSKERKVSGLDM